MKTLLFLLLPFCTYAQLSIGLSTGASFPTSDFGDTEYDNEASQFAATGLYFDLQPAFYFTENIGIAAVATFALNSVDEDAASSEISAEINGDWQFTSTDYKQWQFFIGPTFRINNSQFNLQLLPFVGLTSVDNINQRLNSPVDFPGIISNININGDEALTYGGQAALSFPLSDHLDLGLQVRYLISDVERSAIVVTVDGNGGIERVDLVDDTALSSLQTGLLLSYRF